MNRNYVTILGWYVLAMSVLQMVLYAALSLSKGTADWLIYFDPRIGLFYLESGLRGKEEAAPTLLRWVSAFWLFGISIFLLSGRLVGAYVLSEPRPFISQHLICPGDCLGQLKSGSWLLDS